MRVRPIPVDEGIGMKPDGMRRTPRQCLVSIGKAQKLLGASLHRALVGLLVQSGDIDSFGCNCGVDGSSRRSCSLVGLYGPKIAVLAVRVRQSQGAMNAPAHIPFCALRAIASSATYALEYRMKAIPRPSRTSHALKSPSFVEQVASHRLNAPLPLVTQEVSRDPMC